MPPTIDNTLKAVDALIAHAALVSDILDRHIAAINNLEHSLHETSAVEGLTANSDVARGLLNSAIYDLKRTLFWLDVDPALERVAQRVGLGGE